MNPTSRDPRSCIMACFTVTLVVSGPGVNRSLSPGIKSVLRTDKIHHPSGLGLGAPVLFCAPRDCAPCRQYRLHLGSASLVSLPERFDAEYGRSFKGETCSVAFCQLRFCLLVFRLHPLGLT